MPWSNDGGINGRRRDSAAPRRLSVNSLWRVRVFTVSLSLHSSQCRVCSLHSAEESNCISKADWWGCRQRADRVQSRWGNLASPVHTGPRKRWGPERGGAARGEAAGTRRRSVPSMGGLEPSALPVLQWGIMAGSRGAEPWSRAEAGIGGRTCQSLSTANSARPGRSGRA